MGLKGVAKRPPTKKELAAKARAEKKAKAVAERQAFEAQAKAAHAKRVNDNAAIVEVERLDCESAAAAAVETLRQAHEDTRAQAPRDDTPIPRSLTDAMIEFYMKLKKKSFQIERLFNPGSGAGATSAMIAARGWKNLTSEKTPVKPSVVREFYAALATNRKATKVTVREVTVDFSAAMINHTYAIPEVDNTQFLALEKNPDFDTMIHELAYPGTKWVGNHSKIPAPALSRIGRAWLAFICHSVKSSTRLHVATWNRVILLYAICSGCDVDVGREIMRDIQRFASLSTTANIPHPSLITRLCVAAGVPCDPYENELASPPSLDKTAFGKLVVVHDEPENPHGLGFIIPTAEPVPVPVEQEEPHEASPSRQKRRRQHRGEASSSRTSQPDAFNMSTLHSMMLAQFDLHRYQQMWMTEMGERQVLDANHRAEWESVHMANQNDFVHPVGSFAYVYPAYPERLREPFPVFPPFPEFHPHHQHHDQQHEEQQQHQTSEQFTGNDNGGSIWGL